MLVLFETAAGYAIFKLLDEKKLAKSENLYEDFSSPEAAGKIVKLKHFEKFADISEALAATTAAIEGKLSKQLKKTLKKHVLPELNEQLLVADAKLGNAIKDKLSLQCITNSNVQELMRCIRSQADSLIAGLPKKEMTAMALGLAHSLSRYKLKFNPDKVDTMIVQSVGLLDDLDKELNNYIMRCREWYGWHFPEMGKIITDNIAYIKTIQIIGSRDKASTADLSDILPEDVEEKVKEAAEISMGTEISEEDVETILAWCGQVLVLHQYRTHLFDYLKSRMLAVAPNLSVLVGELVGARLVAHAGSLMNLAKHPASTVQILGAEKALFRALKTKRDTPKYGLIYHSALVGQSSVKNKGKMSRMLAAKAALATRVDALGDDTTFDLGAQHKRKLEERLRVLEEGSIKKLSGTGKARMKFEKYFNKSEIKQYPTELDSTIPSQKRKHSESEDKKPLIVEMETEEVSPPKKKSKTHGHKSPKKESDPVETPTTDFGELSLESPMKKKKKKMKQEKESEDPVEVTVESKSPEKKKKSKSKVKEDIEEPVEFGIEPETPKKKKKSKSKVKEDIEEPLEFGIEPETPKKKKKSKSKVKEDIEEPVEFGVEPETPEKKKKSKSEVKEGIEEPVEFGIEPETPEKKKKSKSKVKEGIEEPVEFGIEPETPEKKKKSKSKVKEGIEEPVEFGIEPETPEKKKKSKSKVKEGIEEPVEFGIEPETPEKKKKSKSKVKEGIEEPVEFGIEPEITVKKKKSKVREESVLEVPAEEDEENVSSPKKKKKKAKIDE